MLDEKYVSDEKNYNGEVIERHPSEVNSSTELTPGEEKSLVWKIDKHLMPLMFCSYMLQFLDKTTLGYSAIMGIKTDTHLVGQDYSWASSAFYFGYLFASPFVSILFVKLPLGKFLSVSIIIWGLVLACHGAASSFIQLTALRTLLGVMESVVSPGFSLVTGIWYKRSEHPFRHGVWFVGNATSSLFGGLLAYAIDHIHGKYNPWRWLFVLFGGITLLWGIVLLLFLPDSPLKARWLTPGERVLANNRPQAATKSFKTNEWKNSQVMEALIDPKTWMLFCYMIGTSIPNGGSTNFSSIIISGITTGTLKTLLYGMPAGAVNIVFVIITSIAAAYLKKSRCIIMILSSCVSILGWALVGFLPSANEGGRLFGVYIFSVYAAGFPIALSLISSNVAGFTKKTVVSSVVFLGYCAGNIGGPQGFISTESPTYPTGTHMSVGALAVSVVAALVLRQYMDWENKRRDRQQGVHIDPEVVDKNNIEIPVDADNDSTDWENRSLRYIL